MELKLRIRQWLTYLALAFVFCMPMSVSAKDFYSTSLTNIPALSENQKIYYGPRDGARFLYLVTDIKSYQRGSIAYSNILFLYDIAKKESTQLIKLDFTEADFSRPLIRIPNSPEFVTGLSKSYVTISGHLLVTDGTRLGTKVLGNFGTRYCCARGDQRSRIYIETVVGDDLYFTYEEDIDTSYPYLEVVNSIALWVSDGSVEGTRKVSHSINDQYGPSNVFANQYVDSGSVFYFTNEGIWQVGNDETSPFIPLEPEFVRSVSSLNRDIKTTVNGNFFCGSVADGETALWRFSNSGKLNAIMRGCDQLFSHDNRLFVISGNGVYESDGRVLGAKLLFRFNNNVFLPGTLFCSAGDNAAFLATNRRDSSKGQLFEVDSTGSVINRSSEFVGFVGDRSRSFYCQGGHILVRELGSDYNRKTIYSYDLKSGKEARVLDRRTKNTGRDDSDALLFFQSANSPDSSDPPPIFHHKAASPALSSILSELMNDEP